MSIIQLPIFSDSSRSVSALNSKHKSHYLLLETSRESSIDVELRIVGQSGFEIATIGN